MKIFIDSADLKHPLTDVGLTTFLDDGQKAAGAAR